MSRETFLSLASPIERTTFSDTFDVRPVSTVRRCSCDARRR